MGVGWGVVETWRKVVGWFGMAGYMTNLMYHIYAYGIWGSGLPLYA